MAENQSPSPVAPQSEAPIQNSSPAQNAAPSASLDAAQNAVVEASTPEEKKEAIKQLKKLQLKVGGKVQTVEFDPNDDEFLTRELQKSRAFDSTSAEKAAMEKEIQRFITDLRKNPRKVLMDPSIGVDFKKEVAKYIEEEIENSKKSPDQIEREKLQAELKSIKEEREKEKEEEKKRSLERQTEQEFERYDMLMTQALEKHTDLPKSPYVVKKIANYLELGLQRGMDVTPEDVIPLVREEIQQDLKDMFSVLPEEVIEKLVGKDKINGIRKKNLAKAKAAPSIAKNLPDTGKSKEAPKEFVKKQTFKDFFGT